MSGRPSDWSPLDRYDDPVPGDPTQVRQYASHYADVAEAISSAATRLRALVDRQDSESKFVDEFRDKATKVASDISKAHDRYASVATAAAGYATPLENAQNDADAALIKARNARDAANGSTAQVTHYQNELFYNTALTDAEKTDYTQKLQHYQSESSGSEEIIAQAKKSLQDAIDSRDHAANHAISLISDTENSGGLTDSWWDRFWDKYGDLITKVLGIVAAIALIVIAFIPGLDLVEFAILGIVAAVTIMNAVTQMNTGKKPIWEGVLEIGLSLLPIGGAAAVRGAAEGAVEESVEAAGTTLMKSAAGQGISGVTRKVATEAVENATKSFPATLNNVLKVALREGAPDIAKMQAIAKLDLTVGGTSARVAGIVEQNIAHIPFYPGPGLEYVIDNYVVTPVADKVAETVTGEKEH